MYTSLDYEFDSINKSTGNGYLRLALESILHATFFPSGMHDNRETAFLQKLKFLRDSTIFNITCDLIRPGQPNFDKEIFRKHCIATLERNYLSIYENSVYIKRNKDRSNIISAKIK